MDWHKQTWWFVSIGLYALERGLDLAGYTNLTIAYLLWGASSLSFFWAIYLNRDELTKYHIRMPFRSPIFLQANKTTEEGDNTTKPLTHGEEAGLAKKQAVYINNNTDLSSLFSKLMEDGHLKLPWKLNNNGGLSYCGKGLVGLVPEAKGITIGDLVDEGLELPNDTDKLVTKIISLMPVDTIPSPEDLESTDTLRYFINNNIIEPANSEAPLDALEKLQWYFPTKQAELILHEMAEINRRLNQKRI